MDERMEYLRSKRLSLMAISVSQFILGSICVLLWTAGIEFCQSCFNTGKLAKGCQWTSTLQGAWGGGIVLICGIVGFVHSISPSASRNSKYIIVSIASVCASTGMVILEVLLERNVLIMNQTLFIEDCFLPSNKVIWNYFHYTLIAIGGISLILGFTCTIMAGYAQCGCCGVYCDTEADRQYNRTYSYSRVREEAPTAQQSERSFYVHSCVHHSCNPTPPVYRERVDTQPEENQQEAPLTRDVPEVDDLLRIDSEDPPPSQEQENLIDLDDTNDPQSEHATEQERQLLSPPPPYST